MGMRVDPRHLAVGGPARVGNSHAALHLGERHAAVDLLDGADLLPDGQAAAIENGDTTRVVAPVLEISNALEQGCRHRLLTNDPADSAHEPYLPAAATAAIPLPIGDAPPVAAAPHCGVKIGPSRA